MSTKRRNTSLIAEQGESLAKISFARILGWTARKDEPDDGVDLNVEIPAENSRPSERFLVQVKTASAVRAKRDGSWPASIRATAARKYLLSRHPVFLLRVDLKSDEIRWLDLSGALRENPERRTFSVPASQVLKQDTADTFRSAVRAAIERQDDRHHPPAQALRYRA